jgi:hypothetical protein
MLWFFEREGVHIRYEVRPSELLHGFELVIHFPDGRSRREVFLTHAAVLTRQQQLETLFKRHGWVEYADLSDFTDGTRPGPRLTLVS